MHSINVTDALGVEMRLHTAILSTTALLAGFAVQSATAADLAVRAPVAVPVVHRWDGLYASFSAGGTWTDAKSSELDNATDTINVAITGVNLGGVFPLTIPYRYSDSMSGKDWGAVFTFTMGYNVVWGPWVAGIQSEVSYNKSDIHLSGTGASQAALGFTIPGGGPVVGVNTNRTGDAFAQLSNNWTISEMARIGYLVAPDWQVYGLIGWSWAGFRYSDYSAGATGLQLLSPALGGIVGIPFTPAGRNDASPFVLGGITWGAGVEKDFGWLRAFVQYKGISYGSHTVNYAASTAGALNIAVTPGGTASITDSVVGSAARSFKADVNQVTAGVTIPINWHAW